MKERYYIPVNSTAARVISKGIRYEVAIDEDRFNSESPPPLTKITEKHFRQNPLFVDFTHVKYGNLTVIGLAKSMRKGKAQGQWVVKCDCGNYEIRTAKAIKNHLKNEENLQSDMCSICQDTRRVRIIAQAKSMGYTFKEYCERFIDKKEKIA